MIDVHPPSLRPRGDGIGVAGESISNAAGVLSPAYVIEGKLDPHTREAGCAISPIGNIIPSCVDWHAWAHFPRPRDMILHG